MKTHVILAFFLVTAPLFARADTEIYIGLGEAIVPLDGVSKTEVIELNQFFESFSGKSFFVRVREGYESDLISMGTPAPTNTTSSAISSVSESAMSSSSDAASAATEEPTAPAILGPFEIAGVYVYDTETGVDRGVDCEGPTMKKVAPRTYEFICLDLMNL